MIFEYALEPELVATWSSRQDFRYFVEKFGLGQARLVSRFPKSWKARVWESFESQNDIEKKRMEELLARLSEHMVQRKGYIWTPDQTWLENAHRDNQRVAFHALLARTNPTNDPHTLAADKIDEAAPLWSCPRSVIVSRTATAMAEIAGAMLRAAQVIIFVDPYFKPQNSRSRRPLEAFLQVSTAARPVTMPRRIEVHTTLSYDGAPNHVIFCARCEENLPRCVPVGLQVDILVLEQKNGGQQLHNRYILTDVGGLVFGNGLDEGRIGETDDVTLMDRAQYESRWSQHAGDPTAFDVPFSRIEIRAGR